MWFRHSQDTSQVCVCVSNSFHSTKPCDQLFYNSYWIEMDHSTKDWNQIQEFLTIPQDTSSCMDTPLVNFPRTHWKRVASRGSFRQSHETIIHFNKMIIISKIKELWHKSNKRTYPWKQFVLKYKNMWHMHKHLYCSLLAYKKKTGKCVKSLLTLIVTGHRGILQRLTKWCWVE